MTCRINFRPRLVIDWECFVQMQSSSNFLTGVEIKSLSMWERLLFLKTLPVFVSNYDQRDTRVNIKGVTDKSLLSTTMSMPLAYMTYRSNYRPRLVVDW